MKCPILCSFKNIYSLGRQAGVNNDWLKTYGVTYFAVGMILCHDAFSTKQEGQHEFFRKTEQSLFLFEIEINTNGETPDRQNIKCSRMKLDERNVQRTPSFCMQIRLVHPNGERYADFNLVSIIDPDYYPTIYKLITNVRHKNFIVWHGICTRNMEL